MTYVTGQAGSKPEAWLYDLARGVGARFSFGDQGSELPDLVAGRPRDRFRRSRRRRQRQGGRRNVRRPGSSGPQHERLASFLVSRREAHAPSGPGSTRRAASTSGSFRSMRVPYAGNFRGRPGPWSRRIPTSSSTARSRPTGSGCSTSPTSRGGARSTSCRIPALGEKRQVSTGGAIIGPLARRQSHHVFPAAGREALRRGPRAERHVAEGRGAAPDLRGNRPPRGAFDVTLDGKRLLFAVPIEDRASARSGSCRTGGRSSGSDVALPSLPLARASLAHAPATRTSSLPSVGDYRVAS